MVALDGRTHLPLQGLRRNTLTRCEQSSGLGVDSLHKVGFGNGRTRTTMTAPLAALGFRRAGEDESSLSLLARLRFDFDLRRRLCVEDFLRRLLATEETSL